MNDLFRENILEHHRYPRCHGTLDAPDVSIEDANPLCGDHIRMDLRIRDNVLEQVRFSGQGCSISQAAASMLCEHVEGRTLDEIKALSRQDVLDMLGIDLGPVRLKCAMLALKALKSGIWGVQDWPGEEEEGGA